MKRYFYILTILVCSFFFSLTDVYADTDLVLSSGSTSYTYGDSYDIYVTYNYKSARSLSFTLEYRNMSCVVVKGYCPDNRCSITGDIKEKDTVVALRCRSVNDSNASVVMAKNIVAKDASNKDLGMRQSAVSITINNTFPAPAPQITQAPAPTTGDTTTAQSVVTTKSTTKKKTTTSSSTTTTTTEEVTTEVTTTEYIPHELRLKNLKIIGHEIDFSEDRQEYDINVREDVNIIDVIATPYDHDVTITNTGKVDIEGKNKITILLKRNDEVYRYVININRKKEKKNYIFVVFIIIISSMFIGGVVYIKLSNKKKEEKEEIDFIKENKTGIEDAQKLLEEELEITQTFYNLNKRD